VPDRLQIILASGSKARQQMLSNAGIAFELDPADLDETALKQDAIAIQTPAPQIAVDLATAKARTVSARHPGTLVIGSDQILELEGELLSKVRDLNEAAKQIRRLQGRKHFLHSAAVCCRNGHIEFQCVETAELDMWPLDAEDICEYLQDVGQTILGSVGCYQIEGKGVRLFREITGSHFTIMGMPLIPLLGFLRERSHANGKQGQ
jgi:septum formation protein